MVLDYSMAGWMEKGLDVRRDWKLDWWMDFGKEISTEKWLVLR